MDPTQGFIEDRYVDQARAWPHLKRLFVLRTRLAISQDSHGSNSPFSAAGSDEIVITSSNHAKLWSRFFSALKSGLLFRHYPCTNRIMVHGNWIWEMTKALTLLTWGGGKNVSLFAEVITKLKKRLWYTLWPDGHNLSWMNPWNKFYCDWTHFKWGQRKNADR